MHTHYHIFKFTGIVSLTATVITIIPLHCICAYAQHLVSLSVFNSPPTECQREEFSCLERRIQPTDSGKNNSSKHSLSGDGNQILLIKVNILCLGSIINNKCLAVKLAECWTNIRSNVRTYYVSTLTSKGCFSLPQLHCSCVVLIMWLAPICRATQMFNCPVSQDTEYRCVFPCFISWCVLICLDKVWPFSWISVFVFMCRVQCFCWRTVNQQSPLMML